MRARERWIRTAEMAFFLASGFVRFVSEAIPLHLPVTHPVSPPSLPVIQLGAFHFSWRLSEKMG